MKTSVTRVFAVFGLSLASLIPTTAQGQEPVISQGTQEIQAPQDPLFEQVEKAIVITSRRQLTAGVHTPWQVVHGILALRENFIMKKPEGGEISGIDWMASGALHNGEPLFQVTPYGGRGHPFTKPYAFEGHPTQFLGYMAMADLPLDFEFQAGSKKITVQDILNDAKMQVHEGPEVTWTLWALSHYLDPDSTWTNSRGERWSIERLVDIQTRESVLSSACGGSHGLFVLAYARNRKLASGQPLTGVWVAADQKVKRYIQEARALQNRDGSFSASYFRGPQYSADFTKRLPANGHTLEWLMIALPESQLKEPWVRRGAASVAQDLIVHRNEGADCGPLYHALHGLMLFNFRTNPSAKSYAQPILDYNKAKQEARTETANAEKPIEKLSVENPEAEKTEGEKLPPQEPLKLGEEPTAEPVEKPAEEKPAIETTDDKAAPVKDESAKGDETPAEKADVVEEEKSPVPSETD